MRSLRPSGHLIQLMPQPAPLRCRIRSPLLFSKTSGCSTTCSTVPAPRRCSNWLAIPSTLAPISDSSACSTPGDRTLSRTLTHNAWHYHLLRFHRIKVVDFPCSPPLASACRSEEAGRRCSAPVRRSNQRGEFPKERVEPFVRTSTILPPPTVRSCGDSRHILEPPRSS